MTYKVYPRACGHGIELTCPASTIFADWRRSAGGGCREWQRAPGGGRGGAAVAILLDRVLAGEPARPQGRNGDPKPSSLSLFEWALSAEQEQEREAEPVGPRR